MTEKITAKCTCGELRLEAEGQPILQLVCHCADCRAASGNDFSSIVFFKKAECHMEGDGKPISFTSELGNKTQRIACAKCGVMTIDKSDAFPHMLGVVAERISPPFKAAPKIHVWAQSKVDAVVLPTDVKIFKQGMS